MGDGAAGQLARAGVNLGQVRTIFISHLHFDHTGGLFAFLGERYQARHGGDLSIYGPLAAIRGPAPPSEGKDIKVVEIGAGAKVAMGSLTVTAAANSHYSTLPPPPPGSAPPLSLSFRFDAPGRSILYTGDTGPSDNVERLCRGAELLVSEIMDPVAALAAIKASRPDVPDFALKMVEAHPRRAGPDRRLLQGPDHLRKGRRYLLTPGAAAQLGFRWIGLERAGRAPVARFDQSERIRAGGGSSAPWPRRRSAGVQPATFLRKKQRADKPRAPAERLR